MANVSSASKALPVELHSNNLKASEHTIGFYNIFETIKNQIILQHLLLWHCWQALGAKQSEEMAFPIYSSSFLHYHKRQLYK